MTELGDGRGRVAYEWKELPKRLDTEAFERVLGALEKLTGEPVTLTDLLEYVPEPEVQNDEQALLDTSTADLADTLDALEADLPPEEREAWLEAFARTTT
jgi:hypothetical protein